MVKKVMDAMTEMQESILNEVNDAINDFISGRNEEGLNILRDLANELSMDILISKGADKNEQFEKIIDLGVKKYAENEYKKS